MRKFLRIFFWSHGAPLGYLGSLSQKGHPEIFSKWVLINLTNPLRHPAPLVDPLLTKNLETAGPWCAPLRRCSGRPWLSVCWNPFWLFQILVHPKFPLQSQNHIHFDGSTLFFSGPKPVHLWFRRRRHLPGWLEGEGIQCGPFQAMLSSSLQPRLWGPRGVRPTRHLRLPNWVVRLRAHNFPI